MYKFIIAVVLVLGMGITSPAQIVREGNVYSQVKKEKKADEKTGFIYCDSKGVSYDIYMGPTGSCYIKRVSKKTGKEYKQYLGEETSKDICTRLGKKYTPRSK